MTDRELRHRIQRRAHRSGVTVDAPVASQLAGYLELLFRWNRKINLTSLTDGDEAVDRLIVEPLVAARHVPSTAGSLIDVGSGGGSPALPLKLAVGRLALVMVEAKVRKAAFLREAARHLQLADVRVETSRFEELLARPEFHESMDIVSLRAVRAEASVLLNLQAFLKPGGRILWFRGPAGPDAPDVPPPLVLEGTYALVDVLRSRLTVVTRARVGRQA